MTVGIRTGAYGRTIRPPARTVDRRVLPTLVDDTVLELTGYKTPDLLKHFWGLKELGSQGYDLYDLLIPVESRGTELLQC